MTGEDDLVDRDPFDDVPFARGPVDRVPFVLADPLPSGRTVLEASAGTGKTYSLTALITRYVAEQAVPVDEILVVTFTRAAAGELRERTREVFVEAAAALDDEVDRAKYPWMSALREADNLFEPDTRRQRLLEALTRFDDLTITTIHGFCQQALGQLGLRSGSNPDAALIENTRDIVREVCRDLLVVELGADPGALSTSSNPVKPARVETELVKTVLGVLSNPGARLEPARVGVGEGELIDADDDMTTARRWADVVDRAVREVHARQLAHGQIGYDSLVADLRAALADPVRGHVVAQQLAHRYSVVLVDEFQDTDRLQWEVFEAAFGQGSLITVGDPKQAIYRFRGADVLAYLDAVAGSPTLDLATNYRSDRQLLAGLEHLFDGATLGDDRIEFTPVAARPDAPDNALGSRQGPATTNPPSAATAAAVCLRMVPQDQRLRRTRKQLAMPLVRPLILADLVGRTIDMLDNGTITEHGVVRDVEPGDIAVLVPTHAEAHHVAEAMQRAGIAAVRTRTGSVLTSPAVFQWRLLLAAMSRPHQASVVRAAALGWFIDSGPEALTGNDADDVLADLQERVAQLADELRRHGLASFYDRQKTSGRLLTAVLSRRDGDRHLTDLDHVAELLAQAMHGDACDAPSALRVLEEMVAANDERNETTMRRIDSDRAAVQITSIHAAKGLEYPIVFVPFSFKPRLPTEAPYSFNDHDDRRVLDVAYLVPWDGGLQVSGDDVSHANQTWRKHFADIENDGDSLRLLYVALTRAQHHLEIWWASITGARASALGRLLLDREDAGPIANTQPTLRESKNGKWRPEKPGFLTTTDAAAEAQIRAFAAATEGAVQLVDLPAHLPHPTWRGSASPSASPLAIASTHGHRPLADPSWKRWSFTRLAAIADRSMGVVDERSEPAHGLELGGADEPTSATDGVIAGVVSGGEGRVPGGVAAGAAGEVVADVIAGLHVGAPAGRLADVVGGTTFGTFVHGVLEQLDFASVDLAGDVRNLVAEGARRYGLRLDTEAVVDGLVDAVRTPLGPLFDGRALANLARRDRLAELTFDFAVGSPDDAAVTSASAIGETLLSTLSVDDPVRPFARQLTEQFAGIDLSGWMHGSIDAVFRVAPTADRDVAGAGGRTGSDGGTDTSTGSDGQRFVVVDYKTNRLHPLAAADPNAFYDQAGLVAAMEHHLYPLQALLYSVALHRYLRWRLGPTYAPEQHLGGAAYLFVRGMVGPNTQIAAGSDAPHGVFSWRPPAAAVLAVDDLFVTGGLRVSA